MTKKTSSQRRSIYPLVPCRTCLGRCCNSRNPEAVMDKKKPAICVFCGSSFCANPRFREAARTIGGGIAAQGYSLVFGGGRQGLMGDVAIAAEAGGAKVQGIIP